VCVVFIQASQLETEVAFLQSVALRTKLEATEEISKARSQADEAIAKCDQRVQKIELNKSSRIERIERDAAAALALKDVEHSEELIHIHREAETREASITAAARAEMEASAQIIAHQREAIAVAEALASATLRAHEEEVSSLRAQYEAALSVADNRASEVREEIWRQLFLI